METDRKTSKEKLECYDLEILLRRPSLRATLPRRVSELPQGIPTEDTICSLGCIKGRWLQSFANRSSFISLYGVLGSFCDSSYAYIYGVITTLEKRFGLSSQTMGTILVVTDITQVLMCLILTLKLPKAHRMKWVGLGIFLIIASSVTFSSSHFIFDMTYRNKYFSYLKNHTLEAEYHLEDPEEACQQELEQRNIFIILFIVLQILRGLGGSLYFTMGKSYRDDNITKDQPLALLCLLLVLKTLGPAFGYWLSSVSLKIFEFPELIPNITEDEPHWIGAWWLGSLIIGFTLTVPGLLVTLFPKTLPKAAVHRIHSRQNDRSELRRKTEDKKSKIILSKIPSITCTHFAAIFNLLGFIPYFIFLPKYAETQYRISASSANLITGSFTLISSAFGIVAANSAITRYRPSARTLASWTVIVGFLSVGGLVSYIYLGCQANDYETKAIITNNLDINPNCSYTEFFPVCDEYGQAYVSPCHAGCQNNQYGYDQGYKICNKPNTSGDVRKVFKGLCQVDCHFTFLKFIMVTCMVTFIYATGRTSNFWFDTMYEQKHGITPVLSSGMSLIGFLTFISAPILFGYIIDDSCLIWEKNCNGIGNCWLYDNQKLRFNVNVAATGYSLIGIILDLRVWFLRIEKEQAKTIRPNLIQNYKSISQ